MKTRQHWTEAEVRTQVRLARFLDTNWAWKLIDKHYSGVVPNDEELYQLSYVGPEHD